MEVNTLWTLFSQDFLMLHFNNIIMIVVGLVLIYLAIA